MRRPTIPLIYVTIMVVHIRVEQYARGEQAIQSRFSKLKFLLFLPFIAFSIAPAASAVETADQKPLAFTHVTIVDVVDGQLLPNMTVVIERNRIVQVEQTDKALVPKESYVYQAEGKYLIPGLWDMHVHLLDDEKYAFPSLLANGVTGVRDMGASLSQMEGWVKTSSAGQLAPRVFFSGPALDGPKTSGDGTLMQVNLKSEDEAKSAVQALSQYGVDFLKIYTYLPRNMYVAIVDEAKKQGIPIAGHVPFSVSAREASEMGQRSIEHLYGILIASSKQEALIRQKYQNDVPYIFSVDLEAAQSYDEQIAQELFETLASNETHVVPTLVTFHNLLSPMDPSRSQYAPTDVQQFWADYQEKGTANLEYSKSIIRPLYERFLALVADLNQTGVPIMAGTDTLWSEMEPIPNQVFGFTLHDELELLVDAGLSPLEALQAATITPARFMEIADSAGSIEEQKWADLVLLDQNPLEDIVHTRLIEAVVVDGQLLDKSTLQTMVQTFPSHAALSETRE
ncbi:amidohydrolase family protein [Brevibacillus sp. AY1]|uniref:amidohydrolase family protein n=1 Tax=Brevibacillus sp. AY1 TaxID=2807621 RepID=UPI0024563212|nr:amidohydrolase family protein [Brevibacillus sp. AY1]MDH4617909.1 amidohydrolase family protein [Brevibacillus sp. AY1]